MEIPPHIKRFILTSIESVPHLEALLLLWKEPAAEWNAKILAQKLYVGEKKAQSLLDDLCGAGFASCHPGKKESGYFYNTSHDRKELVRELNEIYSKNLIAVTQLIHSKIGKQAQDFGDAFKWKTEGE